MGPACLLMLCLLASPGLGLPRFEVYWESQGSFNYNTPTGELNNPWYIDLGAIDVGAPGYLGGPNLVTIHAANNCRWYCQEQYHDEFCNKYPPEGVPALPRSMEDWGTKFNITANMMAEGIEKIHMEGGTVNLAYGGQYQTMKYGITTDGGEDVSSQSGFAQRIANSVTDWNLDGVDFFFSGPQEGVYPAGHGGNSAIFHLGVIKWLRFILPAHKTISYTTVHEVNFALKPPRDNEDYDQINPKGMSTLMETVIAAAHPYLDWFSFRNNTALDDENLNAMSSRGIPLHKLQPLFDFSSYHELSPSDEVMAAAVDKIKLRGLAGLSVWSINKENNQFRGAWARMVAGLLYL